jgi:hypothetical protein
VPDDDSWREAAEAPGAARPRRPAYARVPGSSPGGAVPALPSPGARGPGVPVVVSEWELTEGGDGSLTSRPRLLAVPRSAVTVKDDDAPGRERVRRFVEAWRWLIAARAQIQRAGLSADESDRYLAGAGVLVRIVPPGGRRRGPYRR